MGSDSRSVAYVVPVGPTCQPGFVRDTLESIAWASTLPYRIFLVSHATNEPAVRQAAEGLDNVETVLHRHADGLGGRLYYNLAFAYAAALDRHDFSILIRMDTDALLIGKAFDAAAAEYFGTKPDVGLAGRLELAVPGRHDAVIDAILGNASWKTYFMAPRRPAAILTKYSIRRSYRLALYEARQQGYRLAEYVNGGAYVFRRECLEAIRRKGNLPNKAFVWTNVEEDHLFGILVRGAGFKLGDLDGDGLPMAIAHRSLPDAPEKLLATEKKLVHSVRRFEGSDESAIREIFRAKRQ